MWMIVSPLLHTGRKLENKKQQEVVGLQKYYPPHMHFLEIKVFYFMLFQSGGCMALASYLYYQMEGNGMHLPCCQASGQRYEQQLLSDES